MNYTRSVWGGTPALLYYMPAAGDIPELMRDHKHVNRSLIPKPRPQSSREAVKRDMYFR